MKKARGRLVMAMVFLVAAFSGCMRKTVKEEPVVVAPKDVDTAAIVDPEMLQQRTVWLEMMARLQDTSVYKKQVLWEKLFELYIAENNPDRSLEKAEILADSIARSIPDSRKGQFFQSIKILFNEYHLAAAARDSIGLLIERMNEESKGARLISRKQSRLVDSLNAVIERQSGAINKLQELDLRLEQQRRKLP